MTDMQYIRFQTLAGGAAASNLTLLRVCYSKFNQEGKTFKNREARKQIYKALIQRHERNKF